MRWSDTTRIELGQEAAGILETTELPLDSASVFISRTDELDKEWLAYTFTTMIGERATSYAAANIVRRAVDLEIPSPLRNTFLGARKLTRSKMNPGQHKVAGEIVAQDDTHTSVLQLALPADNTYDPQTINHYMQQRRESLGKLMRSVHEAVDIAPLNHALLNRCPTSENSVLVCFDYKNSRGHIKTDSARTLRSIEVIADEVKAIVEMSDGRVATLNGDGGNLVIPIPARLRTQPGGPELYRKVIMKRLGSVANNPLIRMVSVTGYVTKNKDDADTGDVFWDLNEELDRVRAVEASVTDSVRHQFPR